MTDDKVSSPPAAGKQPWFKFFPSDWRSDASLRMCSPGARMLWLEMLCLMHDAAPRGHLLVKGRAPTMAQLGMLSGITEHDTTVWATELREAEVFSETDDGVIFSRKMVKDTKTSADQAARVAKRWSGKTSGNTGSDTEPVPKKPEARSQIETDSNESVAAPPKRRAARIPETWTPNEGDFERGRELHLSRQDVDNAACEFRDYWLGAGKPKLDWSRTFRSRLVEVSRRRAGMAGRPAPGGRGRQDTTFADIAAQRRRDRESRVEVPRGEAALFGGDLGWADGAIEGHATGGVGESRSGDDGG